MLLVAWAVVALGALPPRAAADITGVTVSPERVGAGKPTPATVRVQGTGVCLDAEVDFGDGTKTTLKIPRWPRLTVTVKGLFPVVPPAPPVSASAGTWCRPPSPSSPRRP